MKPYLRVAILAGQMEWSGVLAVTGIDVGPTTDE